MVAVLPALFASGCMSPMDSFFVETNPAGWFRNDTCRVAFHNDDTVSMRSIDILLMYDGRFATERDSVVLQLTTVTPDSVCFTEPVVLHNNADNTNGGSPLYHQSSYPYRKDVLLNQEGEYSIGFSHASPNPIEGLKAVGIKIRQDPAQP